MEFREGVREETKLLLGFAGSTGSGKTLSAMRVAQGIAGPGKRFTVIDTENRRALHYADRFSFDYGELHPPFTPAAYLEAIKAAAKHGNPVVVVDSASHEHAGEGGLLDMHEEEVTRLAGADADWRRRDAVSLAAWVRPKREHKRFVNALLQLDAHVILCFRAEEKIEVVKVDGKTEYRPKARPGAGAQGWIPVSEKYLPYELTASYLLLNDRPGIPHVIKTEDNFEGFVSLEEQLTEETGKRFAAWAAGETIKRKEAAAEKPADSTDEELEDKLRELADEYDVDADEFDTTFEAKRRDLTPLRFRNWMKREIANLEAALEQQEASV